MIENVSDTAFMVAAYRARESERPDALFKDPLAARLVGERGRAIVAALPGSFMAGWSVVIRTVLIDDLIREAITRGVDTVLNLGAGLDTRPYRMELPASLRWIEADYDHVLGPKENLLAAETPRCLLERVHVDLTDAAARRALLARAGGSARSLLVLTEGVIPYLANDDVAALAADLRATPNVAGWIVDYFHPAALKFRSRAHGKHMANAPFRFDPGDDYAGFFAARGWRQKEIRYIADEAERLRRPMPLTPGRMFLFALRGLFISPARRAGMRRFAGYVLLEPAPAPPRSGA